MPKHSFCTAFLMVLIVSMGYPQSNNIDHNQLKKLIHSTDTTKASKALVIHDSKIVASFDSPECDSVYMNTASMVKSWTGLAVGIIIDDGGAQTTMQDASKIALLMLNNGKYKGERIVSEGWIEKPTTSSQISDSYGYLWWINAKQVWYSNGKLFSNG